MADFFGSLAVTYWSSQVYNKPTYPVNTTDIMEIDAVIEDNLAIPLVEQASRYVCAVERMELSSNAIFYYSANRDPESDVFDITYIYLVGNNSMDPTLNKLYEWPISGNYTNLQAFINSLNEIGEKYLFTNQANETYNMEKGKWSLDQNGAILFTFLENMANLSATFLFPLVGFAFSTERLASIFGLPKNPTGWETADWYATFSDFTISEDTTDHFYQFKTKHSRFDVGQIPSLLLIRSNLPFESDQSNATKTNIVTDFSISSVTSMNAAYAIEKIQPQPNLSFYHAENTGFDWSSNNGGLIVYIPQERRWLNFSAPLPLITLRFWVEVVYNDGYKEIVKLPYGGKFSLKLGFYLRSGSPDIYGRIQKVNTRG